MSLLDLMIDSGFDGDEQDFMEHLEEQCNDDWNDDQAYNYYDDDEIDIYEDDNNDPF